MPAIEQESVLPGLNNAACEAHFTLCEQSCADTLQNVVKTTMVPYKPDEHMECRRPRGHCLQLAGRHRLAHPSHILVIIEVLMPEYPVSALSVRAEEKSIDARTGWAPGFRTVTHHDRVAWFPARDVWRILCTIKNVQNTQAKGTRGHGLEGFEEGFRFVSQWKSS